VDAKWVLNFMSIFVWRFRDGGMVQNGSRQETDSQNLKTLRSLSRSVGQPKPTLHEFGQSKPTLHEFGITTLALMVLGLKSRSGQC
jgi:hypothetical protein